MLAKDIKITEVFSQDPETGFPMFNNQRIFITGLPVMGKLIEQLLGSVGIDPLANIFSRFGYGIGMGAALNLGQMYDFDSQLEWLKACVHLGTFSGLSNSEMEIHHFDPENKILKFSVTCTSSFEFETLKLIEKTDITRTPICHIWTGALSGYASAVFGSEVLVKEISCRAQGCSHCTSEGRSASEWGLSQSQVRKLWAELEMNPFEKEIELLKEKLKKTKKDLKLSKETVQRLKNHTPITDGADGIIYRSHHMNQLVTLAQKAAPTKSTILILGESGTGKEVIARYIHEHSGRKNQPFRAVNCAAFPPDLLESELFGHVKGAFTGADTANRGLLLETGKGTFFLDEIGEMPLELQSKLLRVLQEREVRPVGGLKPVPIEARIIAATNKDLKDLVKNNSFREDLYYRLAVFPLTVQPLRDRKDDIIVLSRFFLEELHANHPGFDPMTVRIMGTYSWPGNVRELENCIEYALIMAGEKRILPEHLPPSMIREDPLLSVAADFPTYKQMEQRYTQQVLSHTNGNKTKAAKILGISITTLWRRLKEMKINA